MNPNIDRRDTLLHAISDSYRRMASNPDAAYRAEQLGRCADWLDELTGLHDAAPAAFMSDDWERRVYATPPAAGRHFVHADCGESGAEAERPWERDPDWRER